MRRQHNLKKSPTCFAIYSVVSKQVGDSVKFHVYFGQETYLKTWSEVNIISLQATKAIIGYCDDRLLLFAGKNLVDLYLWLRFTPSLSMPSAFFNIWVKFVGYLKSFRTCLFLFRNVVLAFTITKYTYYRSLRIIFLSKCVFFA